jgi:hypothetical protein
VVLMHRATTPAQLAHIVRETRLAVLVVSRHLRPIVCQALLDVAAVCNGSGTTTTSPTTTASSGGGGGNLPHIVWFTDNADAHLHVPAANVDDTNTLADLGVTESDFVEALAAGAGAPIDIRTAIHVASPDTVVKLLPSSGSTGMPKLVVVTDAALFRSVQSASQPRGGYVDPLPTVVYAYEVMRQSHDVLVSGDCRTLCHKPLIDNSVYSHYLFQLFGAFVRRTTSSCQATLSCAIVVTATMPPTISSSYLTSSSPPSPLLLYFPLSLLSLSTFLALTHPLPFWRSLPPTVGHIAPHQEGKSGSSPGRLHACLTTAAGCVRPCLEQRPRFGTACIKTFVGA